LILACAIVLVSTAFLLIGVARNRAGSPLQTIELTERELVLQSQPQDNSGVSLNINWRHPYSSPLSAAGRGREAQFDSAKLRDLGFAFSPPDSSSSTEPLLPSREAFVAFEYAGAAWDRWLASEEESAASRPRLSTGAPPEGGPGDLEQKRQGASRLFIVDAARGAGELLARYPDQRRYLVTRAIVSAELHVGRDPITKAVRFREWRGYVTGIIPPEIHVPLPFANRLAGLGPRVSGEPRYAVTLRYGQRLEPWVAEVRLLEKKQ
jgi:hypothetical protein